MQAMKEICPYCLGTGLLTKHSHLVYDIEEWIKKFKIKSKERSITVKCHPTLAAKLKVGKIKTFLNFDLNMESV